MPPLRIGIQLRSLQLPFKKALHTARELGADAVEIDARRDLRPGEMTQTGLRQLKKLLDDLNLKVAAVGFPTRRGYNVRHDLDARVAATKQVMTFARALGAGVVINQIGHIPAESEGQDWQLLLEVLSDLGQHGNHVGALLAARTGGESESDLRRLLDALPAGALGVNLDPGDLIVNGFSPLAAVEVLGADIVHVHAKDGARDLARSRGQEVPLGRGSVDFPALLGTLEGRDYRGYLTVERERSEDPVFEIGQAVKYLRSM